MYTKKLSVKSRILVVVIVRLESNIKVRNSFVTSQGESCASCWVMLMSIQENQKWEQNLTLQLAVSVNP